MSATSATQSPHTTVPAHRPDSPPPPFVRARDGRVVPFDGERIRRAIEKAYRAQLDIPTMDPLAAAVAAKIAALADTVVRWCHGRALVEVEQIQDEVERALMRAGDHAVARRFLYDDDAGLTAEDRWRLFQRDWRDARAWVAVVNDLNVQARRRWRTLAIARIATRTRASAPADDDAHPRQDR
jgi:hypothetical protein